MKVAEEEFEKAKATFPEFTVYIKYFDENQITVQSCDHYAEFGKSYSDCTAAMKRNASDGWFERQDKDLYFLALRLEKKEKESKKNDIAEIRERLSSISMDLDNLIEDIDD